MKKTRSDALESKLSPEQRAALEMWLFDEQASYAVCQQRAWEGWKIKLSNGGLSNCYQRFGAERLKLRIQKSKLLCEEIGSDLRKVSPGMEDSAIGMFKQRIFELAVAEGSDLKSLAASLKVLVQLRAQTTSEASLKLEREKFEFDASERCLAQLPALKLIEGDSQLDNNAKIQAIRRTLFGALPEEVAA